MYYEFLGKDLDELLQPVLDCGKLLEVSNREADRLSETKLALLSTQSFFLFAKNTRVVDNDRSYEENSVSRGGGLVVTGNRLPMQFIFSTISCFLEDCRYEDFKVLMLGLSKLLLTADS